MAMPLARAAVVTLGLTPAVLVQAYPQYLMQIPNGLNFGMGISHEPGTRKLTSFGRMWSSWHNWAVVCEREFPDAMGITTGAALGDPCCTWVPGGIPDYVLQAVSLEGTVCRNKSAASTAIDQGQEQTDAPTLVTVTIEPSPTPTTTPVPAPAPPTTAPPTEAPTPEPTPTPAPTTDTPSPQPTPTTASPMPTKPAPEMPEWHPSRWHSDTPRGYC